MDCGELVTQPSERPAPLPLITTCDLAQVQEEENEKNRLHNLKGFKDRNECPYCEGYGEIFDPLDLEEPHKECDHCQATGEWPTGESAEELFKRNRFVG